MRTPRVAIVTALVGLYVGILGLIIAVSPRDILTDLSRSPLSSATS
jgi:hypothetical protein